MKILFLGTGTIVPSVRKNKRKRHFSSILIEIGSETLLFDIGPATLYKMQSLGINTQTSPDHLFISHFHIDHCLDYIPLVKSRNFDQNTSHVKPGKILRVYGPPGLKQWNKDIFQNVKEWNYMNTELNYRKVTRLREMRQGKIHGKRWTVTCCPVNHSGGIAFRVDSNGKSFVYSGDMTYDERLCTLGKNADIAAIECSFPNKKTLQGKHLEPTMIAKLAKIGNFKTIVLTHMYPIAESNEKQIVNTIRKLAKCKVLLSHDLKQITI